ncbi:ComF family protein [Mangrovivirga sp. M17]|uniref:ComF family protein n=1 Tax=Mangrovivirga halotolerans TaxID=2993936 RepID=A0ABT3RT40_9BACT|nr:ComF family protein [Mangrovivirga halotolerans]MCX2744795.1 ComF family protein [Mangrovivirga halotolerans]
MLSDFISLFFPEYCHSCGNLLLKKENQGLCFNCLSSLPVTDFHNFLQNELKYRLSIRFPVDFALAYLIYRKGNQTSVLLDEIKYKGNKQLIVDMGIRYGELLLEKHPELDDYTLIPVPIHAKKKAMRGFNQSEEFAKGLSRALGCKINNNLIYRSFNMESQTSKSRWDRWINTSETYIFDDQKEVPGKIILVDDVVTTGATLEAIYECIPQNFRKELHIGVISLAITK